MGRRLRTLAKFISIIFSLVTLVSAAGPLPAARSELATSGSDASSTVAQGVFSDGSDFIGTPEEIYQKVKARRDSLGLFNHTTTLEARNKVHTLIALLFQSPSLENNEADAFESDRCILFSVCLSRAGAGEKTNGRNAEYCYGKLMHFGGRQLVGAKSCVQICCQEGDTVWLCNDVSLIPLPSHLRSLLTSCKLTDCAEHLRYQPCSPIHRHLPLRHRRCLL